MVPMYVCAWGCAAPCGLVVLVCWRCAAKGGIAPLWFGGVGRCPLLFVIVHNGSKIFDHAQNAPNGWAPLVMLSTRKQQRSNTLVCRRRVAGGSPPPCGVVCWCVGCLLPGGPPLCGAVVLVMGCVGVNVCVLMRLLPPLWFGGGGVLMVC